MITEIKQFVSRNKVLSFFIKPVYNALNKKRNFSSKTYWEKRYVKGRNSGAGSYGRLAKFKAEIINDFVKKNEVKSAIEFGCGDGSQTSLLEIPKYIGLDVSRKSIELCKKMFASDNHKSFFLYDSQYFVDKFNVFSADLTLSLDVIYHLVEDSVFEKYMHDMFSSSKRYVIIYSSNTDKQVKHQVQHVLHRKFSDWIERNYPDWKLITKIKNKHSLQIDHQKESFADFYVYQKE